MSNIDQWETRIIDNDTNKTLYKLTSDVRPSVIEDGDIFDGYRVITADFATGCKTLFLFVNPKRES